MDAYSSVKCYPQSFDSVSIPTATFHSRSPVFNVPNWMNQTPFRAIQALLNSSGSYVELITVSIPATNISAGVVIAANSQDAGFASYPSTFYSGWLPTTMRINTGNVSSQDPLHSEPSIRRALLDMERLRLTNPFVAETNSPLLEWLFVAINDVTIATSLLLTASLANVAPRPGDCSSGMASPGSLHTDGCYEPKSQSLFLTT